MTESQDDKNVDTGKQACIRRWQQIETAARDVVNHSEDVRQVLVDQLIEGAIVLRPETFCALREALDG